MWLFELWDLGGLREGDFFLRWKKVGLWQALPAVIRSQVRLWVFQLVPVAPIEAFLLEKPLVCV
jgi:hypothetical protein